MVDFDDSQDSSENLIPLEPGSIDNLLTPQLAQALLLAPAIEKREGKLPPRGGLTFHHNNSIWEEVNLERLKRSDVDITLDSFFLFEWLPRSPGLYYTPEGRSARREAKMNIMSTSGNRIVYNPYGKLSMLDGGVGSIRLKPLKIEGENHFFVSASSSGLCDEGFPVAIPEDLFNKIIDEISSRGSVVRTVTGKLKFIPDELEKIYSGYRSVPKRFLKVEQVSINKQPKSRSLAGLTVNVAVSFLSSYEGEEKVYATYVGFEPGDKNNFRTSMEWLEHDYVHREFNGKIITDFDQVVPHFKSAPFSLSKVMSLNISSSDIGDNWGRYKDVMQYNADRFQPVQLTIKEFYMTKYNISGGIQGIVGDNNSGNTVNQSNQLLQQFDMDAIKKQLELLRFEAKKLAESGEHDEQIGAIASAEKAAIEGDRSKVVENLKKLGKWTFDVATRIGTTLLASVIKEAAGL
jgi:hypothetical protein